MMAADKIPCFASDLHVDQYFPKTQTKSVSLWEASASRPGAGGKVCLTGPGSAVTQV